MNVYLRPEVAEEGELWSARARDWAEVQERFLDPCYLRVLKLTEVSAGDTVLDVGCGAGRFLQLADGRGASVAGLDAAAGMLDIARERVAGGEFRLGDMESLPFGDGMFDVVTGFNSFSHADDPVRALSEAGRVAKRGGRVALTVWGPAEAGSMRAKMTKLIHSMLHGDDPGKEGADLRPPSDDGAGDDGHFHSISADDDVEDLVRDAGLTPINSGTVNCHFLYPDEATLLRGLMSPGPFVEAARRAGEDKVRDAILRSMEPVKDEDGNYSFSNVFRYVIAGLGKARTGSSG